MTRIKFHVLVNDTRTHFPSLPHSESLRPFRDKRNAVVHFGFSPQDDEACAKHPIEDRPSILSQLYRELFDFYLDWQEVHPGNKDVNCLTADEWAKVGLFPQIAEHFRQALEIYERGKNGKPKLWLLLSWSFPLHPAMDGRVRHVEGRLDRG